jgi:hypothetical protein
VVTLASTLDTRHSQEMQVYTRSPRCCGVRSPQQSPHCDTGGHVGRSDRSYCTHAPVAHVMVVQPMVVQPWVVSIGQRPIVLASDRSEPPAAGGGGGSGAGAGPIHPNTTISEVFLGFENFGGPCGDLF